MLQWLRIKNLALLEEVQLEFHNGFTTVTGETGAGKSVLLGALSLLSGSRTDKSIVRKNSPACEVEASLFFHDPSRIDSFLDSLGLPPCDDSSLVLRRIIPKDKPPRIFINGALAPLASLQSLGHLWIDFHGPGEPQKLFHDSFQLQMLDAYSLLEPQLHQYHSAYQTYQALLKQIHQLQNQDQLSPDELAFYQAQIDKIDSVCTSEDSINTLESQYALVHNAQAITDLATKASSALVGQGSAVHALQSASKHLASLDRLLSTDYAHRLNSLIIESEDLAQDCSSHIFGDSLDPSQAHEVQAQMNAWLEIKRKYGPTPQDVINKRNALFQKIASQSNVEERIDSLQKEATTQEKQLVQLANAITQERQNHADALAKKVRTLLTKLGFKKADFQIQILPETSLTPHGNSKAAFLFCPNLGSDLLPLNKIASSGETARVMLALKTILAEADHTPVLVFDEVDANVGGEVGAQVGLQLLNLAKKHQVLCITHLPQVASKAQNHLVVSKHQSNNTTSVNIALLNIAKTRAEEIARMLGDRKSESALSHAQELLGMA